MWRQSKIFFPEPDNKTDVSISGVIEEIYDTHVVLLTEDNVKMKISFKNFHLLRHFNAAELQEEKNISLDEMISAAPKRSS